MTLAGRIAIVWPKAGWSRLDLPAVAADVAALGFDAVSLHAGLDAAADAHAHVDAAQDRAGVFRALGLRVAVGLGFPKPAPINLAHVASGIAKAVLGGFDHVQLDWEGAWDGHRADAATVLASLRQSLALDALPCPVTSLCWWAPRTLPSGGGTHPSAPTAEFLALTAPGVPVLPQCYNGGRDGDSAAQLAWSRSQYAPRPVAPTIQGYAHSTIDRVALLLAEPTLNAWDYVEWDADFRRSLRARLALEKLGLASVRDFQSAVGLEPDGKCGRDTLAKLGIA